MGNGSRTGENLQVERKIEKNCEIEAPISSTNSFDRT